MGTEQPNGYRATKWVQSNQMGTEKLNGFRAIKWVQRN